VFWDLALLIILNRGGLRAWPSETRGSVFLGHPNYNQNSFLDHPDSTLDDPRRCGEFREMEELLSYGLAGGI